MPFGRKIEPWTFQCAIDILSLVKRQFAEVYLYDIVIIFKSPDEYIDRVRLVLTCVNDAGVIPRFNRCKLHTHRKDYLRHAAEPACLRVCSQTILATSRLQESPLSGVVLFHWPVQFIPPARTEVRRDCGTSQPKIGNGPHPSVHGTWLRKVWSLKQSGRKTHSTLLLALLWLKGSYKLDTAAGDRQVRCRLFLEKQEGHDKSICSCLLYLTAVEPANEATHRECLVVVWVVHSLCPNFEGAHFTVRTDHDSLKCITNSQRLPAHLPDGVLECLK